MHSDPSFPEPAEKSESRDLASYLPAVDAGRAACRPGSEIFSLLVTFADSVKVGPWFSWHAFVDGWKALGGARSSASRPCVRSLRAEPRPMTWLTNSISSAL